MKAREVLDVVLMRRPRRLSREEYFAKLTSKGLKPDGSPVLDPRPLAPPVGYKQQPSMVEIVRDMVRSERLAQEARLAGAESFEEADDLEVGDEPELLRSPWENEFDPPIREMLLAGEQVVAERSAAVPVPQPAPSADPPSDGPKAPTG